MTRVPPPPLRERRNAWSARGAVSRPQKKRPKAKAEKRSGQTREAKACGKTDRVEA